MKIGAIIQARMSSSRLPGKVLKELPYGSGITNIEQIIKRVKAASHIDEIILATSTHESDKPLVDFAKSNKINVGCKQH